MPRLTVLLLTAVMLLVLAACDGGDGGATPTTTDAPAATAAFEGGREPVEVLDRAPPTPLLVDVRTGQHEGFDRVVFEFRNVLPGYRIEYVQSPIAACGSGMPVTIAGDAFLQMRMTPAAAHDEQGNVTFGTTEITPALPTILEVESTCDFEGEVTWVLGLSEEVDFNVFFLTDPYRLVIDVSHP